MKASGPTSLSSLWARMLAPIRRLPFGNVIHNIAMLAGASFAAQVLMAINAIAVARILAPETYGIYIGTYSAVTLSSLLFNWGLDTWILRQGALAEEPRALTGTALTIKSSLGILWIAVLFFLLPAVKSEIFLPPLVLICSLDIWFDGLLNASLSTLNTQRRIPVVSGLLLGCRGGRLVSTIVLFAFGSHSPLAFAEGRLVATFAALVIALWILKPKFALHLIKPLQAFKQSLPFALADLLATIGLQADVTLLALFLGDRKALGLYASAENVINAFFAIPGAAYQVVLPALTRQEGQPVQSFYVVVRRMFLGFLVVGLILWLGLWLGGGFLIDLVLGPAYHVTGSLLSTLSPILLLKSLSFAGAALIVAVGWQNYRVLAQIISAAANILINIIIIRPFGIFGVAVVYVLSEFILAAGYIGILARWFKNNRFQQVLKWK